ncbi:SPOR domain-containing protein [Adhaeribacter aquaticus]|uniref:HU domain-containing protein n=1 Tax=Adhaeribacter aquaticus TaxID=299567 RepID=UPI0004276165|nr:SPOR domain-containing protein [Adhaeribacter aquaticus]
MIQEHIHKLLFEHDCVIIPDFGGLITHYEPARIHPIKHTFLPPSKRIAFNEKLKLNDGLLISTLAYDKHLSPEDAHNRVSEFVFNIQEELKQNQRFEFKGIGIFKLNSEHKLEFDYIPSDNFLEDSFGLPELLSKPVISTDVTTGLRTILKEKQNQEATSTTKPTLRRRVRRLYDMAAVMAISGLTVGALYFLSLQTDYDLSSLNFLTAFNSFNEPALTKAAPVLPDLESASNMVKLPEELPQVEEVFPTEALADSAALLPSATESELLPVKKEEVSDKPQEIASAEKITPETGLSGINTQTRISNIENASLVEVKKSEKPFIPIINKETSRFYIIAGGYSSLKNAERSRKYIFGSPEASKIILPFHGGKLHRVSVADFSQKDLALASLPTLRKKFGNNIWILNY